MKQKIYKQKANIKCGSTTKQQLDNLKLVECETYESVIERLIEGAMRK